MVPSIILTDLPQPNTVLSGVSDLHLMLSGVALYDYHLVFYFLLINANIPLLYIDYEVSLPESL